MYPSIQVPQWRLRSILLLVLVLGEGHAWSPQLPVTGTTTKDSVFPQQISSALGATSPVVTTTTSPEIIPREVLFGNPVVSSPKLSPDGRFIAYLSPNQNNVMNIHVRRTVVVNGDTHSSDNDTVDAAAPRVVTQEMSRGIKNFKWAEWDQESDTYALLYLQDKNGDENFHLYCICFTNDDWLSSTSSSSSPSSTLSGASSSSFPVPRDLTPGRNVKASTLITNKRFPNQLLVATNERNPSTFDVYRIENFRDPDKTTKTLDTRNPGCIYKADAESFEVRFSLLRNQQDSSNTLLVRSSKFDPWKELVTFPFGEEGSFVDFCNDGGKSCYILSSLNRDTKALLQVDLATGQTLQEIYANDQADVDGILLDDDTKEVRLVSYTIARHERVFFDKELELDFQRLEELGPGGEPARVSATADGKLWIVAFTKSDGPTDYQLYDQVHKTLKPLFVSQPEFLKYKFAPMEDVRIPTRDGLEIVGYLTRAKDNGEATPLILRVHGGPWLRDYWGFSAVDQWFANRGYATLSVNYRGSTGYGKTFQHMGDGQWGIGGMQHDLTDAVQWAIQQGIADPERICIYGGSYGGYACLAGLAFTPDLFRCGVDIVGPSNVKTMLDGIPAYWGPLRKQMLLKIGNVDADQDLNTKISPLFHVDKIKAPLLIGQGANDPRVKRAEADRIAFSMKAKGIPVEYVLYPDEGHGFARPENRIDFNGRVELFLQKHLGGRAQEFQKPKGSTARFPLEEQSAARQDEVERMKRLIASMCC